MKNETDFDSVLNDVFEDFEQKRVENSNLCQPKCDENDENCIAESANCIDIITEDTKLRNSSTNEVQSEVSEECVIRYTASETCAIVNQNMQTAKLAEG